MNDAHRKARLRHLIATDYEGKNKAFGDTFGVSKGRLSQMIGAKHPFGEAAARTLAEKIAEEIPDFDPDWFSKTLPTPKEKQLGWRDVREPDAQYLVADHIKPASIDGGRSPSNVVYLTPSEHRILHEAIAVIHKTASASTRRDDLRQLMDLYLKDPSGYRMMLTKFEEVLLGGASLPDDTPVKILSQ